MIDKKEIINIVFSERGIKMEEDDSILDLLIVHDVVLGEYIKTLEESVKKLNDESANELRNIIVELNENHQNKLKEIDKAHAENDAKLRELINAAANKTLDAAAHELAVANESFIDQLQEIVDKPIKKETQNNTLLYSMIAIAAGFSLLSFIAVIMFAFSR